MRDGRRAAARTASSRRSAIAGTTGNRATHDALAASAAGTPPPAPGVPRFSKRFAEEWLYRATLRNSLRAWAAAQRSSWLRVPRVLLADPRELRIDYELLVGWKPVRTVIRHRTFQGIPPPELRRLFWAIGAALEELHRHTRRIHGDFDFDNVLVKRGADRAVFVDFTPPDYARFPAYNRGDVYRDIALFVLLLRAKYPPHQLHLAMRAELRELARAFVRGYFRTAPDAYDRRLLERCANELLETTYLGESFAGRYLRRSRLFRTDDLAPTA
ncbi:MAG TPA: hypothetical protein VIN61_04605 [Gammaproteobacteria bacterium]